MKTKQPPLTRAERTRMLRFVKMIDSTMERVIEIESTVRLMRSELEFTKQCLRERLKRK